MKYQIEKKRDSERKEISLTIISIYSRIVISYLYISNLIITLLLYFIYKLYICINWNSFNDIHLYANLLYVLPNSLLIFSLLVFEKYFLWFIISTVIFMQQKIHI